MEKSIETIWKEGFREPEILRIPKVKNLYNQKSIHLIDRFKRMFRINLTAIIIFSFVFLGISYFVGIPIMGIIVFLTLQTVFFVNKKLLKGLEKIDKGENSYQYLKTFNQWIEQQISINKRISTLLYPVLFMSIVLGFWFKDTKGEQLGHKLVQEWLVQFPGTYLISGVPLVGVLILFIFLAILAFFGGRIYLWDVHIVYGRIFKKLKELIHDLEDLSD
ncbi:hypothetical protein LAG90_17655 [Marinilongibacter aquaticus]|uniref:hypothetical protein n=1 Tax=Marinilongibacter aquaticus TaxID=2975157 RepID=UPI0021BD39B0|nr:hypothetical protein [Marinilongibacter aquaticus]UBM58628.1 hypothetical protein LAG90_17655 [Marinilongibacter aquaticus]